MSATNDTTNPAPVNLTPRQHHLLTVATLVYSFDALEDDVEICELLLALKLLRYTSDGAYKLTPAGLAALAESES